VYLKVNDPNTNSNIHNLSLWWSCIFIYATCGYSWLKVLAIKIYVDIVARQLKLQYRLRFVNFIAYT